MSSPTSATTKRSLDLSDSSSLSPDSCESPLLSDAIDRLHFKVYRLADKEDKRKYVGRCWTVDAKAAAIKLGTRGLPRVNCTAQVIVERDSDDSQPPQRFTVRQFFGEITPLAEAKYAERGALSPDGRMKYKELVEEPAKPAAAPTRPANQAPFRTAKTRPAPSASPAAESSKTMMVPVWIQVPEGFGYSNPWSMPQVRPTVSQVLSRPKQSAPSQTQPARPKARRAPVTKKQEQHPWHLNPTERYTSAVPGRMPSLVK
jgi:hypothetical protein